MSEEYELDRNLSHHCPIVMKNVVIGWCPKPSKVLNGYQVERIRGLRVGYFRAKGKIEAA